MVVFVVRLKELTWTLHLLCLWIQLQRFCSWTTKLTSQSINQLNKTEIAQCLHQLAPRGYCIITGIRNSWSGSYCSITFKSTVNRLYALSLLSPLYKHLILGLSQCSVCLQIPPHIWLITINYLLILDTRPHISHIWPLASIVTVYDLNISENITLTTVWLRL